MGAFLTSLGSVLAGQRQGQQASNYAQQQFDLEKLKLATEQRRALASTKQIIQLPDGSFKVVDLADPTSTGTIGDPTDYGKRLQSMLDSNVVPESMKALVGNAIKTGDRGLQTDLYNSVTRLISSPTFEKTNLSGAEKKDAITQALPYAPPQLRGLLERAAAPDASPALVDSAYKALNPAFGSSLYGVRVLNETGIDPTTGLATSTPFVMPSRGGAAVPVTGGSSGVSAGGALSAPAAPLHSIKIGAAESRVIGQGQAILNQLADLKRTMQALGPERWNRNIAQRGIDYQKATRLNVLPSDPALARAISQLITVEASAKAALGASAGMRAYNFLKDSQGHIPTAYGDYNSIMTNIDTLSAAGGPYKSLLSNYGVRTGGEASTTPTGPPDLSARGYVKLPDGTWYNPTTNKYDDGK